MKDHSPSSGVDNKKYKRFQTLQRDTSSHHIYCNKISQSGELPQLRRVIKILECKRIKTVEPFTSKSLSHKHFSILQNKLGNFKQILNIFQDMYESQKIDLKDELNEILLYKQLIESKYSDYEGKLIKMIHLSQRLKQEKMRQNKYFLKQNQSLTNQNLLEDQNKHCTYQNESSKHQFPNKNQSKLSQEQKCEHIIIQKHSKKQQRESEISKLQEKIKFLKSQKNLLQKAQQQTVHQTKINNESVQRKLHEIGKIQKQRQLIETYSRKLKEEKQNTSKQKESLELKLQQQKETSQIMTFAISHLYVHKKALNNALQQLRGNIRVNCRIRPLAANECQMFYKLKSHDLLYIKKTFTQHKSQNAKTQFQFTFDRIFDQENSQTQVFSEISQSIQSAIDGVNVCIFAYGQTGSGKTFTMQGKNTDPSLKGLIPRSTQLIFEEMAKFRQQNWQVSLEISINQIYNDSIVNLLFKSAIKTTKPVYVVVNSIEQVQSHFAKAISNRSTAFTLSNADSSRSHLIFVLKIKSLFKDSISVTQKVSHLVLIDLAGSERVKESGVSNQRLKQAQHINKSLSELGQVIRSLKDNKGKANFRNSKLTYFLEPYLQKGSKAIMLVNISPAASDESQSINSLKFASVARECRLQSD